MKLHNFLYLVSAAAVLHACLVYDPAAQWFIACAIAFFAFIFACIAKSFHDDKVMGNTSTRDAMILLLLWKLFGGKRD
jgi:DMSO/TMAO reductase YedYZ heme-binding membrane subunit